MDPLSPILTSLIENTITQLLQTAATEEIDNPYLRAIVNAAAQTFASGIMQGLTPEQMREKMGGQLPQSSGNGSAEESLNQLQTMGQGAQQIQ